MSSRKIAAVLAPVSRELKALALPAGANIVLGLSGGADSVSLLHALVHQREHEDFELIAAHFNHALRGDEADRDEAFVRELCAKLGVPLVCETARELQASSSNLEEAARRLRYEFLDRVAADVGASSIALAHNADDQAETVLMRLMRGAGAAGLAAMAIHGPGRLWRPLLRVGRSAILEYLGAIGARWVEDSSNGSTRILRNRIRIELMPRIEREFAAGFSRRLAGLAEEMRAFDAYLQSEVQSELVRRARDDRLDLNGFAALPQALSRRMIREFLNQRLGSTRRISRDHINSIDQLCRARSPSARLALPGEREFRRDYDQGSVVIAPRERSREDFVVSLNREGTTEIPKAGFCVQSEVLDQASAEICNVGDKLSAIFDCDRLCGELIVRNFRPGDRVQPLGSKGHRKLQDVFIDAKLHQSRRSSWPIVVAGEAIVWVPGMVRSRDALVTNMTKKIRFLRAWPMDASRKGVVA